MQIVIQIPQHQLAHVTNQQMGAFVAHCYQLKDLAYVKVVKEDSILKPYVEIAFSLPSTAQLVDSAKLQGQLEDALKAFADMEPFPCPCGCGAFISVSPCLRQSGQMVESDLSHQEMLLVEQGNQIGAIKSYRERKSTINPSTGERVYISLREAKDACDKYREQYSSQKNNMF